MNSAATAQTTIIVRRPRWDYQLEGGTCVVTILPDMDWNDCRRIRRFLDGLGPLEAVVCDCRHVEITSTAAIGWLITLYRWCVQHDLAFQVSNPIASSMATYRAEGLDRLIPIAA